MQPNYIQESERYSYQPMPVYDDQQHSHFHFSTQSAVQYKMDLNLYCIKKPQKTFFMRVNNPHLLSWGIDIGDMLVVERTEQIKVGDLVVLEQRGELQLYEFFSENAEERIFFALDSKLPNVTISAQQMLPLRGVITNIIHQFRGRNVA